MHNPSIRWGGLSGLIIPGLFSAGTLTLGGMLEGYSHSSQTVSEIGALGSPFAFHWLLLNTAVGLLFLPLGFGVARWAKARMLTPWPGYLLFFFGLMTIGMAQYPAPQSMHNVFGLLMMVGYASPLVAALAWKPETAPNLLRGVAIFSTLWVWSAIFLNLSPLLLPTLYPLEYYGLMQRALFTGFHGSWCISLAVVLLAEARDQADTIVRPATAITE